MLNSKQILQENLLKLENAFGKPAQVGYDLSLKSVNKMGGKLGRVYLNETILNKSTPVQTTQIDGREGWLLEPGVYDFMMNEGCKIAPNRVGLIRQRSSLMRNGAVIQSSVFDPGFETENIGTYCIVHEIIFIEENARVAQIYFHECSQVGEKDLYNGQWQGDLQRNI